MKIEAQIINFGAKRSGFEEKSLKVELQSFKLRAFFSEVHAQNSMFGAFFSEVHARSFNFRAFFSKFQAQNLEFEVLKSRGRAENRSVPPAVAGGYSALKRPARYRRRY
jgi:hypothetical protein